MNPGHFGRDFCLNGVSSNRECSRGCNYWWWIGWIDRGSRFGNARKRSFGHRKEPLSHHKVCGEYVSNEVRPYLYSLGLDVGELAPVEIEQLQLGTFSGKMAKVKLPLGGFGISRYALDNHLYELAKRKGVAFHFDTVLDIIFEGNTFMLKLSSKTITASVVIGAFGKRSNLDKRLNRPFIERKSAWLAVKCHYADYDHPDNIVSLQTFPGGYGGLSKTEAGNINFCYLAQYDRFKKTGNHTRFREQVLSKNKILDHFLENATPVFKKPISIGQVSFDKKKAVENHVLMCGDTAGLIHPLCGNGMAMAIHGGKMAAEGVNRFLENTNYTRIAMERDYEKLWNMAFRKRLWMGRALQNLMLNTNWFDLVLSALASSRVVLTGVISSTHGKPILN